MLYEVITVLRTGEEVLLGINHMRKGAGVFHHLGNPHHPANIDATVADKYPNARGFDQFGGLNNPGSLGGLQRLANNRFKEFCRRTHSRVGFHY